MEWIRPDQPLWKGNLHMHTTASDGRLTPAQAIACYREQGYHFIAITDHDTVACPTHTDAGMLILSGIELGYELPGEELHLVGLHVPQGIEAKLENRFGPQVAIDEIRQSGGRVIVAHPAWSLLSHGTLSALRQVSAAEIYNSMSTMPRNCLRADSSSLLDAAASHGSLFPLVAVDDAHFYDGEQCRSYVMAQAESLTAEAILRALDERRFYATQGPRIHRLYVTKGRLVMDCSPVSAIVFYSNLTWVTGRCRMGENLTHSEYDLTAQRGETFVRCQLIDAQGLSAWSNPICLADWQRETD